MGVRELREAFQEVVGPEATCVKAFMDTIAGGSQVLIFSGLFPDNSGWVIQSEPVPPSGDLTAASRQTARELLNRDRVTT